MIHCEASMTSVRSHALRFAPMAIESHPIAPPISAESPEHRSQTVGGLGVSPQDPPSTCIQPPQPLGRSCLEESFSSADRHSTKLV